MHFHRWSKWVLVDQIPFTFTMRWSSGNGRNYLYVKQHSCRICGKTQGRVF